ncbi:MAG: AAA family ATPase, partial [Acetobacteraceae bacterium]|nr:AAA family ATPase [Acetobacteraceae bacterium]
MSESAYRLVLGLVDASYCGSRSIRGKAAPERVYRLHAIRQGAARFQAAVNRGLTTFVGRQRELQALKDAWAEARRATCIVDVVADAGIGKSRLLHEFRLRLGQESAFILSGSCSSDRQQTPFLPFIEVVRGLFQVSAGATEPDVARRLEAGLTILGLQSPENIPLLLNLLGLREPGEALAGLDRMQIGLRTRDLLLQLLESHCRTSRALLLLEDLHWIDTASAELLDRIFGSEKSLPLLVVHTRRANYHPPWSNYPNVRRLVLAPLSPGEISSILQARLGTDNLPEDLRSVMSDRVEGNPLFAEELATDLLESAAVRQTPAGLEYDLATAATALPTSLQGVLMARADRLSSADQMLLQAAAVIGRCFDLELLASVTNTESSNLELRMRALQEADLVRRNDQTGELFFKHVLVRDAFYERLLSAQRSELHLKVAEEVERRGDSRLQEFADVLAYHFGRTSRRDKAFCYLSLAGRRSLDIYALDAAEGYFRAALEVSAPEGPLILANVVVQLLEVIHLKSDHMEVRRIAERYLSRLESMGDTSQLVFALTFYSLALGVADELVPAEAVAHRALETAERIGDDRARAYAAIALLSWSHPLRRYPLDVAQGMAERLLRDSMAAADNYAINGAYFCLSSEYVHRGLFKQARGWAYKLLDAGRERGDPRALGMAYWVLSWIDCLDTNYEDAIRNAEHSMQAAVTPIDRFYGAAIKASAEVLQDRPEKALAQLQAMSRYAVEKGLSYFDSQIQFCVGIGLVRTGGVREGLRLLERSISERESRCDYSGALW